MSNIHGMRVGLFTPDMAFGAITKRQIGQLEEPSRLRLEAERIITTHIRQREQKCKEQLILMIEYEVAYMNTNHKDAQNNTGNKSKAGTRSLGNEVIRKGHMCINNLGIMKGRSRSYWFVLTSESIPWFKDEDEK
ncbi:CLUMA_CG013602, isoform A [Clunio marinus]|uniref:CLUMA_CG013602, isoform A n=1 Tax=Clunio marinus TaxID=568069 RepID=A0A1J1IPA9_9DIPT|nr:CLUMA_CG013602, isoform A [Clunio marinus]